MRAVTSSWLGESVHWETLQCGMRLFVLPRAGWRQRSALLAVDFGAMDRRLCFHDGRPPRDLAAGVAHFIEHRLFEKASGDITERFGLHGAEVDGDTSYTHTGFSFSCREGFDSALELLLELVFLARFTSEGVERERDIIAHEIRLSSDAVDWVGYLRALDTVFPGQTVTEDIAGTAEGIEHIDAELLSVCHDALYRGAHAGLFVAGDVDPFRVREQVVDWLAVHREASAPPAGWVQRRPLPGLAPVRSSSTLPISRPHLTLAFRDPRGSMSGLPLLRRELALELASYTLFGPSSRWYTCMYEGSVIDSASFGFEINMEPTFGVCLLGGNTPVPGELEAAVLEELQRAVADGVSESDFMLAKRKAYGDLVRAYDSAESAVELMHSAVSCGARPLDFLNAYEQLTLAETNECVRTCLRPESRGCSLIEPAGESREG